MKKVLGIAAALVLLAGIPAFAAGPAGLTGFGVYGSVGSASGSLSGGVGLSFKWASFPVVGLKYDFTGERFGASVDYYVIDAEGKVRKIFTGIGSRERLDAALAPHVPATCPGPG